LAKRRKPMTTIEKYKLDESEASAFQLSEIWVALCEKYFPNYKHTKLKAGDPRKSLIFKICYKLQRETKGLIPESEYKIYIQAQLEILRYQLKNNPLILIDPMCLVGDKAWKRWKLWKKRFDSKIKAPAANPMKYNRLGAVKAINEISKTKTFIEKNIGSNPTIEDYKKLKSSLLNWINFGNISLYYLVISPYMKSILSKEDYSKMNFDPILYKECINEEVIDLFKKLFPYELKNEHTKDN